MQPLSVNSPVILNRISIKKSSVEVKDGAILILCDIVSFIIPLLTAAINQTGFQLRTAFPTPSIHSQSNVGGTASRKQLSECTQHVYKKTKTPFSPLQ